MEVHNALIWDVLKREGQEQRLTHYVDVLVTGLLYKGGVCGDADEGMDNVDGGDWVGSSGCVSLSDGEFQGRLGIYGRCGRDVGIREER